MIKALEVVKIVQCGSHYRDQYVHPQPHPGAVFCFVRMQNSNL